MGTLLLLEHATLVAKGMCCWLGDTAPMEAAAGPTTVNPSRPQPGAHHRFLQQQSLRCPSFIGFLKCLSADALTSQPSYGCILARGMGGTKM